MKEKFKLLLDESVNTLIKVFTHLIYFIIFIVILNTLSFTIYNISIPEIIKDIVNKELGSNSYISKKMDYELYAISPYKGFDIDKMRNETDGYVNYHKVGFIKNNLNDIKLFINKKHLQTYQNFFIDLNNFHYQLIFNKFNYDKNKALLNLYNILMKYKCTLEEANQSLFKSKIDKNEAQKFLRTKIFLKLDNLLVEILLYTKSISIVEFNSFKNDKKMFYGEGKELWNSLVQSYSMEFASIIRGNMCTKQTIIVK
jgi:hypothetical protein